MERQARDHVESGEEQYYPAMQVGPAGNSFSVVSIDLKKIVTSIPLYDPVHPPMCM
jgi:hypothetical protein